MTLDFFLNIFAQAVFFAIVVVTVAAWLRFRDRVHLNIALLFVGICLAMLADDLRFLVPELGVWPSVAFFMLLAAQPYLLFRVVRQVGAPARVIHVAVLGGLAAVWATLLFSEGLPVPAAVALCGYYVVVQTYVAAITISAARRLEGVPGLRLRLTVVGSLFFSLFFLLTMLVVVLAIEAVPGASSVRDYLSLLSQLLSLGAALCYFAGFSPPRWLRQTWHYGELSRYLTRLAAFPLNSKPAEILDELLRAAKRSLGGASRIEQIGTLDPRGVFAKAWYEGKAAVVRVPGGLEGTELEKARLESAKTYLIAPLKGATNDWGLLVVTLRHASLFAGDELGALAILCEQTLQKLEGSALVGRLSDEKQVLEDRVNLSSDELSKTQSALAQSGERYRKTLDDMMEGCQMIGFDWRYLYVNESLVRYAGRSRDQLLGHTMMEAYPGIEATELFKQLEACMSDRKPRVLENRFVFPDGREAWFDLSIQSVPEGIFVLSIDISERKRSDKQLYDNIAKLERNNRELQEFAYVASHDLQEPLRKIQAFGERLIDSAKGLDDKGRDYMSRMMAASQRMERLIDDLLAFSRITTRAQPFESMDLTAVAEDVAKSFHSLVERSGGSITVSKLPVADVDVNQFRQVFQNLVANAIKFQPPGAQPKIAIFAENGPENYTVTVADNGIGFDEKYLDRIFSPFQRLHPKGEYAGTGIGLAIVRKVVERHGGNVTAESEPGKGASFILTLPIKPPV